MKRNEAFPSKWATAADLDGRDQVHVIAKVVQEPVGSGDKQEMKNVCHFVNNTFKPMVVNSTKWNDLEFITGADDSNDWVGQRVMLSPGKTRFQGKMVDCIVVKAPPKPKAKSAPAPEPNPDIDDESENPAVDMDDEIPY
jgi:hypothetical protein